VLLGISLASFKN